MKLILIILTLCTGQSVFAQTFNTNNIEMANKISDTWDYNLMELLKKAQAGDQSDLHAFMQQFEPFVAASHNQTKLWVLRPFRITYYTDQRQILDDRPDSDDFQWGITLASLISGNFSISHLPLPHKLTFSGLEVDGTTIKIIMDNGGTPVATNEAELFFKLGGKDKPADIDHAFASLCNQQYPEPLKISAMDIPIKLPSYDGELTYNTVLHWYEGQIDIANRNVTLTFDAVSPKELERLLVIADRRLSEKFYDAAMRQMEKDMFHHKNDFWLDEGKEPLTEEMFRNRISVSEITFAKDGSCIIYCDDNGIFNWHTVSIAIDTAGNYLGSGL